MALLIAHEFLWVNPKDCELGFKTTCPLYSLKSHSALGVVLFQQWESISAEEIRMIMLHPVESSKQHRWQSHCQRLLYGLYCLLMASSIVIAAQHPFPEI